MDKRAAEEAKAVEAAEAKANEADTEDIDDEKQDLLEFPSRQSGPTLSLNIDPLPPSGEFPELQYPDGIPRPNKRLVKALRKLQFEYTYLEAEFYKEVHKLECKYGELYAPLYEKRDQIINGQYEPTDEDCYCPAGYEDSENEAWEDMPMPMSQVQIYNMMENPGIDAFWLTALRNVDMISDMIQPEDEIILRKLTDIKVKFLDSDPMGFELHFHFAPNDYFTNAVLTKAYEMRCVIDDSDPFQFDGPEIYKCYGCKIDWKTGKDITVKTVTKKQKHKNSGSVRLVRKTVVADSFFNFFNPPIIKDGHSGDQEEDSITRDLLAADFEIGHFLRERFVPRAVLFYTGEAIDIDDLECEGEDEEDLEEEEERN